MAAFDIVVSGGARATALQGFGFVVSTGTGAAFGNVPWNTSTALREANNWLPRADHSIGTCPKCKTRIPPDPLWYRYFKELSERMGGIQGQTIPQVATAVGQTQLQVVATTSAITDLTAYARSIDETASALAQVAVDNALTGAETVPLPSDPPDSTIEP